MICRLYFQKKRIALLVVSKSIERIYTSKYVGSEMTGIVHKSQMQIQGAIRQEVGKCGVKLDRCWKADWRMI